MKTHECSIFQATNRGETPLAVATMKGYTDVMDLFSKHC